MSKALLKVKKLTKTIKDNKILNDITFSLREGSVNAVLCPNNCGKTTLIKTLSGIVYADSGSVSVNDVPLIKSEYDDYIILISTILEDIDEQFICKNAYQEMSYPLINLGYTKKRIDSVIRDTADTLKINKILRRDVNKLKTVDKVKVLLAASIVHRPKLLLIDDAMRFLNLEEKKEIIKCIKNINEKYNTTILFTTSDINDVIGINNILVLYEGKIKMNDTYEELMIKDNELSKMGFVIPIMIDLSRKLQFYNLVDKIYYDSDKVVDALWN